MSKELHHTKICKFTSNCHIQTTLSLTWRKSGPENVFSTACWRPKLQLWHRVFKPQSVFINTKVKGIKPKQDEMVSYIYKFISKSHSQTTHPWIVKSHDEGTFLALFVDNQSHNYDTECSNHHLSLSTLMSKGLRCTKIYKFIRNCHIQTTPNLKQRKSGPVNVFSTLSWQSKPQLWHRVLKSPSVRINTKVKLFEP